MIELQKSDRIPPRPQRGFWWQAACVFVACPDCTLSVFVDDDRINEAGEVLVKCPYQRCSFHGHVRLRDWRSR